MSINLKNIPTIPLVIGSVVTLLGCFVLAGIAYALLAPRTGATPQVAQAEPTATRRYVTATPISTATPTPTDTPTATSTDLPTATPTDTRVPPTRIPATAVPPTNTPLPPTPVLGADLGLDNIAFNISIRTQTRGVDFPYFFRVHNANNYQFPFGYLGVGVQDSSGVSVAFAKTKINSYFDPDETFSIHNAMKVYQVGNFNAYLVICLSHNDYACDQPGADYRQLAGPIAITITE